MWPNFIVKNGILVLHFIALFTLISVAIWDAISILTAYITDNRLTIVIIVDANRAAAYFDNDILEVRLRYDPTIFPESWNSVTKIKKIINRQAELLQLLSNLSVALEKDTFANLSLENKIAVEDFFDLVGQIDRKTVNCALSKLCSDTSLYSAFGNSLKNKDLFKTLQEQMWMAQMFQYTDIDIDIENTETFLIQYTDIDIVSK